jgi:hypothetical protein
VPGRSSTSRRNSRTYCLSSFVLPLVAAEARGLPSRPHFLEVGPLLVSGNVSLARGWGFRFVFQRTGLGRRPVFRRRDSREAMRAGPYGKGRRVSRETVGPCQRTLTGCQRLDGHRAVAPGRQPLPPPYGHRCGAAIESSAPPTFHVKQGSALMMVRRPARTGGLPRGRDAGGGPPRASGAARFDRPSTAVVRFSKPCFT